MKEDETFSEQGMHIITERVFDPDLPQKELLARYITSQNPNEHLPQDVIVNLFTHAQSLESWIVLSSEPEEFKSQVQHVEDRLKSSHSDQQEIEFIREHLQPNQRITVVGCYYNNRSYTGIVKSPTLSSNQGLHEILLIQHNLPPSGERE